VSEEVHKENFKKFDILASTNNKDFLAWMASRLK